MVDLEILIPILIPLIVGVLTVVIPLLLNERWKRKTALTQKLWDLKYSNFQELLSKFWDCGDIGYYVISLSGNDSLDISEDEKMRRYLFAFVVGTEIQHRFFGGAEDAFPFKGLSLEKEIDMDVLAEMELHLLSIQASLVRSIGTSCYAQLSKLSLIVEDQSIINDAQSFIDHIMGIIPRLEEQLNVDEELAVIQILIQNFSGKCRNELEKTRTGKLGGWSRRSSNEINVTSNFKNEDVDVQ